MSLHQTLITEKYQQYLDEQYAKMAPPGKPATTAEPSTVGIVGAGAAGLYSALLLKKYRPDISVKILEASDRVGGCIYTYRFENKPHQYFEAGAMRLPVIEAHEPVFDLISYLNQNLQDYKVELIDYHFSDPSGNRVYVNGTKQDNGKVMTVEYANNHVSELGFDEVVATDKPGKLLIDAVNPIVDEFKADFEAAVKKYDSMTLHFYLSQELGWSEAKINYVEVLTSQTNEFRYGLVEFLTFFTVETPIWKTIDNGMCRLPEAMAKMFGEKNIVLKAAVESLADKNGRVEVGYVKSDGDGNMEYETFDAVILAIPSSAVHMICKKPLWPVALRHALRAIPFLPMFKMGLRFKRRFWEFPQVRPSKGGESISDLPCRCVVYPSYGFGNSGKGVLLVYDWITDSDHWLQKSSTEKIKLALHNLQELYPDVDIAEEYAGGTDPSKESYADEAFPVQWEAKQPLGVSHYYPGQFTSLYPVVKQSQGRIYFAGEHLSVHRSWVFGALDSARFAVAQLLGEDIQYLKPL